MKFIEKVFPTALVATLCCSFYLSSLYLYKQDIKRHDNEIIKVAKEVKDRLDLFNKHIIIKDNGLIKDEQKISSEKIEKILKMLMKFEEQFNGEGIRQ